ncbi:hypothetical protein swp_3223 [Shewanella piezotolerans WP3]|uniref:Uncharacterized protein n=1 Tax=Shewanella piezotolerans (strain WP3 / JCM 13877) TaxID=225849 RepID=B8CRC1_SHEPW|nr:hypothetical protein [Shewanella piezotolerans]ACJ29929.1 hypothetical protein swp_3223 [Shewanella piezotolerans WP3]
MSLLEWIEQILAVVSPSISHAAGVAASVASVFASIAWLVSQALTFLQNSEI